MAADYENRYSFPYTYFFAHCARKIQVSFNFQTLANDVKGLRIDDSYCNNIYKEQLAFTDEMLENMFKSNSHEYTIYPADYEKYKIAHVVTNFNNVLKKYEKEVNNKSFAYEKLFEKCDLIYLSSTEREDEVLVDEFICDLNKYLLSNSRKPLLLIARSTFEPENIKMDNEIFTKLHTSGKRIITISFSVLASYSILLPLLSNYSDRYCFNNSLLQILYLEDDNDKEIIQTGRQLDDLYSVQKADERIYLQVLKDKTEIPEKYLQYENPGFVLEIIQSEDYEKYKYAKLITSLDEITI